MEANPLMAKAVDDSRAFELPKIDEPLSYTGEKISRREAEEASKISKELSPGRIFIPAPSPES